MPIISAHCKLEVAMWVKVLDCSRNVVLDHRNGDAGNPGSKISGLGFPQAKQAVDIYDTNKNFRGSDQ